MRNLKFLTQFLAGLMLLLSNSQLHSQAIPPPPDWNSMMSQPGANFYTIKEVVDEYFNAYPEKKEYEVEEDEEEGEELSYQHYMRWDYYWRYRVDDGSSENHGSFQMALDAYRNLIGSNTSIYNCHQSSASNNLNSNWTDLGPTSMPCQNMGVVSCLRLDPSDATNNTLYAGTWGSGIWRTNNAQSANPYWVSLQDIDGEPGTGVNDIVFTTQAGVKTIYIASAMLRGGYFGVGVFKSTNNGQDWLPTSLSFNASSEKPTFKILVDPTNPYIIWAITPNEVYRMDEFNGTFITAYNYISTQQIYGGRSRLVDIEFDPTNPNIVFVSSTGFSNPYGTVTNLSGARMFKIEYPSLTVTDITPQAVSGVFNLAWIGIGTCPINPNDLVAFYYDETSQIKTKNIYSISTGLWQTPATVSGGVGPNFIISPADQNICYSFGGAYGYKSTNAGLSWTTITTYNSCTEHADVRYMMLEQANAGGIDILWMGTDGGVGRKELNNAWTNKSGTGLNNLEFYNLGGFEDNANLLMCGAQDNNINKWMSPNWQHLGTGDGGECIIDYTNQNHMYAFQGYLSMSESNNGWTSNSSYGFPGGVWRLGMNMKIDAVNPNIVYVPTNELYRFNSGTGFQSFAMSSFNNNWVSNLGQSESNPNIMYVGHAGPSWTTNPTNLFHKTTNAQTIVPTWTDITANMTIGGNNPFSWTVMTDIAVKPSDPNTLWVTFSGWWVYKVIKSSDGGLTWTDESTGLPNYPVNRIVYQKGSIDGLYVATEVGVYFRDNSMSQWECFNYHLPVCNVTDLEINYCTQKIRASTFGRGAWESPLVPATQTITNATWNTPVKLSSNLIITGTLVISADVDIAKGSTITVAPGGILDITTGAHLFNGCNEMWDRINVDGPTAILKIHNNAIVEDAYFSSFTSNGGVIQIDHAHLTQNNVQLHIEGSTASPYPGFIYATLMDNPTGLQAPFPPGTRSNNGIEIVNCANITIGNDLQAGLKNTITDFNYYGIRITNSGATIINNYINSNNTTSFSRGILASTNTSSTNTYIINIGSRAGFQSTAFSKNILTNLWHGIWIFRNYHTFIVDNELSQIRFRGMYLRDCYREIHIRQNIDPNGNFIHNSPNLQYGIVTHYNPRVTNVTIAANRLVLNNNAIAIWDREFSCIDLHRTRIVSNQITDIKWGIWVENDGFPLIDDNRITFLTNPSNSQVGYGILTQNVCFPDITNNVVACLSNPKPVFGICAEMCMAPYICNNYTGFLERGILCRGTMMGTKVKLNIMENNYYGFFMENGGNIGEQGNAAANDVSDNQWINNIYYDTYSIGSSNTNPPNNTFFDVQNTPNYTINTIYNLPPALPILQNIVNPFNPADCADHKGWRVADDVDDAISDIIPDSLITEEERWIRERQLFSIVTSEEIIDTPSVIMEDFISDLEDKPISEFKIIDTHISEAFRDTMSGEPDTIQIDSARVRNLAVVDTKLIEFYSKIINDIYLATIARGNEDFTQEQKDWLYAIAAMCPFEAGPAVYKARVLVAIFDDEILFLDYECDPNSYLRKANEQQQSSLQQQFIKLFPNPANTNLFLDYFMPGNIVGFFYLTDISGKQIFTTELKKYNNHLTIPCEEINSGIYFFKVITNGTISKTGKISIIH